MDKAKPVSTPLGAHFRLSSSQSPINEKEKADMTRISHASQSEVLCTRWYARVPTWPTQSKLSVGSSQIQRKSTGKQSNGYLRGSSKTCLCFGQSESLLQGYTDANMAGDVDSRKSTSGYLITYSGGAVS